MCFRWRYLWPCLQLNVNMSIQNAYKQTCIQMRACVRMYARTWFCQHESLHGIMFLATGGVEVFHLCSINRLANLLPICQFD